jgi:hypothetical protein
MRFDVIYEQLIEKLMARPVKLTGTVLSDEFGLMMIGNNIEYIKPKVKTEALKLLDELGVDLT